MTASWCFQRRNIPKRMPKTPKRLSPQNDGDWAGVKDVRRISDFQLLRLRGARGGCAMLCR